MTSLYFTMVALPPIETGETPVHMYIEEAEPTRTDDPGAERRAAKDLRQVVNDLVRENVDGSEDRLLKEGEIPFDGKPICSFAVACQYDRARDIPHYKRIDLVWLSSEKRFAKVMSVARELYDLTYDTLKKRERIEMKRKNAPKFEFDSISLKRTREAFADYAETIVDKIAHMKWAHDTNKRRFDCEFLKNGYCSPMHSDCPCFVNGKCVEVK